MVCDGSGGCAACSMGASCGTACNPGTFSCSTGAAVCTGQVKKSAGSSCGTNLYCDSSGNCNSCTSGASCGTTCAPGTYSCTTGLPVCNKSNASLGTSCGSNLICDGSGSCVAKTADGGTCTANVACQNGNCSTYSGTGASICCPAGNSNCGSCVNKKTDTANCGACGTKCVGGQTCSSGTCACPMNAAFVCNACLGWDFESGTTSGWTLGTRNDGTGTLGLAASAGRGNYSLDIQGAQFNVGASDLYVQVSLCGGAAIPLPANGLTFSVDVLFQSSGNFGFGDDATGSGFPSVLLESDNLYSRLIAPQNGLPFSTGTWNTWTITFTGTSPAWIRVRFNPGGPSWYGNVLLDNISLK